MNRDRCSPWSGYRKRGRGVALRVGRKVGDNMWEWAVGRIVCVCVCALCVCIVCLHPVSCVLNVISPFSHQKFQLASQGKKNIIIQMTKFFLFFPLIFETSSDCGPFLICPSVFSQAPGSRIFFFIKISYLECMFNLRTPRACFITILGHINIFHKFSIYIQNVLSI